ncbi:unnamed protein product [Mytilus coruscus]|uniref:Uncharacterized protein n=1 Tax=Mytilus coruscus TaxID=42192 RepID=A0A6J8BEQ5_MYTCO|nr:unnamed protein product [Mytilus coruscus]
MLLLILLCNDVAENPGPYENEISIFHLNARSVRTKLEYIETLALGSSIVCITESHLDENIFSHDIHIDGYHQELYRNDRNCFGGGVLVYISEILKTKKRFDLEFENGELAWLEIDFPQHKILLCAVYRSPGDLNVDLFTEHNHVLNDLMNIFCLQNVVKKATRLDQRSGRAALLDPILISEDCCATFTEVIDINREMSDDNATKNFDWQTSLTAFEDDVDGMAVFFTEKYIEMAKNSIPTKTVFKKLRTVQNTKKFKVQSNKVNNMIIYAKEQFYLNANGLLDEKSNTNPKAFWSLVKKVKGNCRSTSIPPLLNPNTNEISVGEKEKADLLNSYFCNISTSSDDGVSPPDLPLRSQYSLDIDEITEDEIKDVLKSLEIGKGSGEDCISHQMLKYIPNSVCVPLSCIFECSMRISKFPSCWKVANVLAFFKKG